MLQILKLSDENWKLKKKQSFGKIDPCFKCKNALAYSTVFADESEKPEKSLSFFLF